MDKGEQNQTTVAETWPNTVRTREELDAALEAGMNSGVSTRTIDEIMEDAIARIENGKL